MPGWIYLPGDRGDWVKFKNIAHFNSQPLRVIDKSTVLGTVPWAISADEATELATMDIPKDDPAWRKWFAAIKHEMALARHARSLVGATVYDEAMLSIDKSVTTGGGSSGGPRAQERPSRQPVAAQPTAPPIP